MGTSTTNGTSTGAGTSTSTSNDPRRERVLISGASFAGLTTAIWMRRLGYDVTVIEQASGLRKGGTPVDLRADSMAVLDRLGLLPAVRAHALPPRTTAFAALDGTPIVSMEPEDTAGSVLVDDHEVHRHDDAEIHRDDLLAVLWAEIERPGGGRPATGTADGTGTTDGTATADLSTDTGPGSVDVVFGDAITSLTETPDGVRATFRSGDPLEVAMVLGCDGNHSGVRRLWFGPEEEYSHFLHHYTSVTVVDGMVIPPWTSRIQNAPGRTLLLNSYADRTDVVFVFRSEQEIPYDRHDVGAQQQIIRDRFADAGSPFTDVLESALTADNFYFDKLSQNRLPRWSSGRVALVGDAAYCPSPAAGMGGSVAVLGATALHDAFVSAGRDVEAAFAEYERSFRPVAEGIQDETASFNLPLLFPDSAEAIESRNAQLVAELRGAAADS